MRDGKALSFACPEDLPPNHLMSWIIAPMSVPGMACLLGKTATIQVEVEFRESDPMLLLDPKELLRQLNLCRRDEARRVQFGCVDAAGKNSPAAFALSPKMAGRKLFEKLQAETGVKTGGYGTAWIEGTELMLQVDKPSSGLDKKVRAPVRACGFRITKVVLRNPDGTVFEPDIDADTETTDDSDSAPRSPERTSSDPPAKPPADDAELRADYLRRMDEMSSAVKAAILAKGPNATDIARLMKEAVDARTRQAWGQGLALFDKIRSRLASVSTVADVKTFLQALPAEIHRLADTLPGAATEFNVRLKAAVAQAQGGDFIGASATLRILSDAIAEATRTEALKRISSIELDSALENLISRAGNQRTVGIGIAEIPRLKGLRIEAASPVPRKALEQDITPGPIAAPLDHEDPDMAAFVRHAEQEFGNQFIQALDEAGYTADENGIYNDPTGTARFYMNASKIGICSICMLNLRSPSKLGPGVVQQLSRMVPNVAFVYETAGEPSKTVTVLGGELQ